MRGILSYLDAIGQLGKLKLLRYFLLSGLISLLIGGGIVYLSYSLADDVSAWIEAFYPWDRGSGIIDAVGDWMSGILMGLLGLLLLKYILLIVMSPIMSYMSERIEARLSASYEAQPLSMSGMMKDLMRSIGVNVRNLSKELILTIILLLVSLIPGAAIVTTPLIFLVQAYYAGFGLLDYYLERHYNMRDSLRYVQSHRLNAIGIGSIYLLILLIPVLGFMIAPILGAAAATIYAIKAN